MTNSNYNNKTVTQQATDWVKKYPEVLETWKHSTDPFKRAAADTMEELAKEAAT